MNRRTPGIVLACSLLAATAAMAIPVAPDPARDSPTNTIHVSWSHTTRSNGYVDDSWWAVRDRCTPDYLGERLLCGAVGALARAASRTFEGKMSEDLGLPLPDGWGLMTAKNSPVIRSAHVETPRDLKAVLGFYRTALEKRGWSEIDDAVDEPERAVITFVTRDGPVQLRLARQGNTTIADFSLRKQGKAVAGILPKPGRVRLLLGNPRDDAAVITVNGKTIDLAAHAGEKLPHSDSETSEIPDSQMIDLAPGKYKVTLKMEGHAAQNREFEVAANETWGLLVGPDGAPLPMRLY